MKVVVFEQNIMISLTQFQCAHKPSLHFLCCAARHWIVTPRARGAALSTAALRFFQEMGAISAVRFGAHQQHLKLLGAVDQELPKATGQHVLVFLLLPQPTLGVEAWPLGLLHIPLSVPLGFRQ